MALIRFTDETRREEPIDAESGALIWKILMGIEEGTKEQQEYCLGVRDVLLDYRHPSTPDEYIQHKWDAILAMHLADWMVDPNTKMLTRPDPTRLLAVKFAKKWDLYAYGGPTTEIPRRLLEVR